MARFTANAGSNMKKSTSWLLFILAFAVLDFGCGSKKRTAKSDESQSHTNPGTTQQSSFAHQTGQSDRKWRYVQRVVDGDTIILDGGERVRLIGVDTPESVHPRKPVEYFALDASAFTKRTAERKRVWLEYDQTRADRYGRTLAYVHLPDGRVLNEEIIRQGYGHVYTRFPFKYLERYRELEKQARQSGVGLSK